MAGEFLDFRKADEDQLTFEEFFRVCSVAKIKKEQLRFLLKLLVVLNLEVAKEVVSTNSVFRQIQPLLAANFEKCILPMKGRGGRNTVEFRIPIQSLSEIGRYRAEQEIKNRGMRKTPKKRAETKWTVWTTVEARKILKQTSQALDIAIGELLDRIAGFIKDGRLSIR